MEDSGEFKGEFMGNFGELGELRLNVEEMRRFFGPDMNVEQLKERIRSLKVFLSDNGIAAVENAHSFILCLMLIELFRALMVPMPDVKDKLDMFARGMSLNMTAPDIGRFIKVLLVTTADNDEMLARRDVRLFGVVENQLLSMMHTADPNFIPDDNRLYIHDRVVGNYLTPETVKSLWGYLENMHKKVSEFMFLKSQFRNNPLVEFLIVGAQFEQIVNGLVKKIETEHGMSREGLVEMGRRHAAEYEAQSSQSVQSGSQVRGSAGQTRDSGGQTGGSGNQIGDSGGIPTFSVTGVNLAPQRLHKQ